MMQVLCVSQECPQRRDCLRSCESPIEKNQLYADYYIGGISCIMKVEKVTNPPFILNETNCHG